MEVSGVNVILPIKQEAIDELKAQYGNGSIQNEEPMRLSWGETTSTAYSGKTEDLYMNELLELVKNEYLENKTKQEHYNHISDNIISVSSGELLGNEEPFVRIEMKEYLKRRFSGETRIKYTNRLQDDSSTLVSSNTTERIENVSKFIYDGDYAHLDMNYLEDKIENTIIMISHISEFDAIKKVIGEKETTRLENELNYFTIDVVENILSELNSSIEKDKRIEVFIQNNLREDELENFRNKYDKMSQIREKYNITSYDLSNSFKRIEEQLGVIADAELDVDSLVRVIKELKSEVNLRMMQSGEIQLPFGSVMKKVKDGITMNITIKVLETSVQNAKQVTNYCIDVEIPMLVPLITKEMVDTVTRNNI